MKIPQKIKIGTRGSALALKQADMVRNMLRAEYADLEVEIVIIITTGDKILDRNLAAIGGKGLFIKEIEEHLLTGEVDIAVHSLKDMPAKMPDEFDIPCVLEREDARDVFISLKYKSISDLPHGAIIGTSSARRAAQLLRLRPDLKTIPFRGNINTRIKRLEEGAADATFLAFAGLIRIGLFNAATMHPIPTSQMLPAVSQGAIGIEILKNNKVMRDILKPLNHVQTQQRTNMERSFMRVFEGSCTTPIAAHAEIIDGQIHFKCLIAKPDGKVIHHTSCSGNIDKAEKMGADCANLLKDFAGENFFA